VKTETFDALMQAMTETLEHATGKRELRTAVLPPDPAPMTGAEILRVRKSLNASQAVFARYLNVSTKLIQAWEANRRQPEGPALILLQLGARNPAALAAAAFSVEVPEPLKRSRVAESPGRHPGKRRKVRAA
jgi:putative transcriptional regulator